MGSGGVWWVGWGVAIVSSGSLGRTLCEGFYPISEDAPEPAKEKSAGKKRPGGREVAVCRRMFGFVRRTGRGGGPITHQPEHTVSLKVGSY